MKLRTMCNQIVRCDEQTQAAVVKRVLDQTSFSVATIAQSRIVWALTILIGFNRSSNFSVYKREMENQMMASKGKYAPGVRRQRQ